MISGVDRNRIREMLSKHLGFIGVDTTEQPARPLWPILFLSLAASSVIAVLLGQDASWDVRNYHFYSGYAFLHKPLHFDFAPAQVQNFFNPLLHVFTYLLLAHLPGVATVAILGAIQGLNLFLLYRISLVLFHNWRDPYRQLLSLVNAAVGFFGAANICELGASFGDNLASVVMLAALLLVFRYLSSDEAPIRGLCLAGGMFGIVVGLKLTTAVFATGAVLALAAALPARRGSLRPLIAFCACLAIGFIATYGYWGATLYAEYQNPFFPYLNRFFRSPYYDLQNTMDPRFLPRNWKETLFYPFFFTRRYAKVSEVPFRDLRFAFCYLAAILLAGTAAYRFLRRNRRAPVRGTASARDRCLLFLSLFFVVSYVVWLRLFSIYRYAVILELLAPTFIALVLAYVFRRKVLALALSLAISLVIRIAVVPLDLGRQKYEDDFLMARIPQVEGLNKSVVVMAGKEPTSYIVPQFPSSTRFVRVSSNFQRPGRNRNLDRKIRALLSQYDTDHTLIYVASRSEMDLTRREAAFYGVSLDEGSCREITSDSGNRGYLCKSITGGESRVKTAAGELPRSGNDDRRLTDPHRQILQGLGVLAVRCSEPVGKAVSVNPRFH